MRIAGIVRPCSAGSSVRNRAKLPTPALYLVCLRFDFLLVVVVLFVVVALLFFLSVVV
jgi:hypothetical protein